MRYTYELARFCAELAYEQLPDEVLAKARKCIADFCAIVVGARKIKKVGRVVDFVRLLGKEGPSSVIGTGIKTSPPMAALANGTFAEILEYQDGFRVGGNHPSSSMIPAAMAIAEANGNSGKDFITAVVAGYEAENRVAAAMATSHLRRGHLPNGTVGTVGAAAAASYLNGLDAQQTADAMGIAGFLAPVSINENLFGCYTIKIIHGGQAARIGIEAAEWAKMGFTGCPLEGSPQRPNGFCEVMSDNPDYTKFTDGLGRHFTILDVYSKPYACCRVTHPSVDATLTLVKQYDLKPEDIEGVTITTYEYATETVGANYPDGSDNFQRCQFSIPYVVAAAIIDRSVGLPQFTFEKITDSKFIGMSHLVRVLGDPELTKVYPATRPTIVEIKTTDGRRLSERVDYPLGDPKNPFTEEMFWEKFDLLISFGLGKDHIEAVKTQLDLLDSAPDIAGLVAALH